MSMYYPSMYSLFVVPSIYPSINLSILSPHPTIHLDITSMGEKMKTSRMEGEDRQVRKGLAGWVLVRLDFEIQEVRVRIGEK